MTITLAQVRRESGATTDLYSDDDINALISSYPIRVYEYFDIKIVPTDTIEFVRNYDINSIKVNQQKIMTLKSVNINGSERDINTITFNEHLGKIQPRREYDRTWISLFAKNEPYRIKVKYSYAMLKTSGTATETASTATAGDSVVISVDSSSDFTVNDYVRIKGFDGSNEVCKITAKDTGEITVDKLYYSHEVNSVVEKLKVPEVIENYMLYDICYSVASNIIGNTSNLPTSWSQEGESATIGVAYTHWREAAEKFREQRDKYESSVWALKSTLL